MMVAVCCLGTIKSERPPKIGKIRVLKRGMDIEDASAGKVSG